MTRQDTNRTNGQSKTSTGKPSMPTVSDLTPRNELKGGGGPHVRVFSGSDESELRPWIS